MGMSAKAGDGVRWMVSGRGMGRIILARANRASSNQGVVVGVRPDPEPHDVFALEDAERSMMDPDPHGVHRLLRSELLEAKARVSRVLTEELVRFPRLRPYV